MDARGEKPLKEDEKLKLQDDLRAIDTRRAQEGREPLPPKASELENKWADMEGAADDLRNALLQRLEYHK